MKIVFEGKIDLPRAEQLLESKGLGLNGPVQQFHTKNVAKPSSSFWIAGLISFFTKNTLPAPMVVPRNGIRIPKII